MRMHHPFIIALFAITLGGVIGCGGGGNTPTPPPDPPAETWPHPVTEAIIGTVPFDAVRQYEPGAHLQVWVNRSGFDRMAYPVEFIAAIEEDGQRKVVCRAPASLQIGHGDSGSPVLTEGNKLIGALAQIFADGDTRYFKCVSIEDMEQVGTTNRAERAPQGCWIVRGVGPQFLARLAASGRRTGPRAENCLLADTPSSRALQAPERLLPGHTVTFDYLRGPASYVVAGTLTYEHFAGKYLALGHGLDTTGECAIPVTPAYTLGMIVTPALATKSVIPVGEPVGSMVRDERNGVLLEWGTLPERTGVKTRVRVPLSEEKAYEHDLTRDHGSQRERDLLITALTTPVEIYLRHQMRASADCTLVLQVAGEDAERIDFAIETNEDVLLGYQGILDRVTEEVQRLAGYYPGRPFVTASLDASIYPDSISQ